MTRLRLRAVASVVAVTASVSGAREAHAEVRVERAEGASACPDGASFATKMGAEAKTSRSVTIRFDRTAKGYRSAVTTDGMLRTLSDDSSSCDGLTEATLLAVRLALDIGPASAKAANDAANANAANAANAASSKNAKAAPGEGEPPAAASPPALPAVSASTAPIATSTARDSAEGNATRPDPGTPRAVGGELLAGGLVAIGIGTPVAPGFRGGAALTLGSGRWSIGMTGVFLPSQARDVGKGQVDVVVAGGGIEGCGRARVSRPVLLGVCARAEVLRLAGTSRGFSRTEEQARPLFAATVLGRGQARLAGPVGIFAEAGVVVPVVRERFGIDGVGLVYDPPPVGASGGIGALVDFE